MYRGQVSFPWAKRDIVGCRVVPSGFVFHADRATENTDVNRVPREAANEDNRFILD
jgi:hypothetical protein